MAKKEKVIKVDDLSALFCKKNEDVGQWFQMRDRDGNLWDIDLLIFGNDSDVVQEFQKEVTKQKLQNMSLDKNGKVKIDEDALDETLNDDIEPALVRLGGVRKHSDQSALQLDGTAFPITKDDGNAELFRNLIHGSPDIKDFVIEQASRRSDFLSNRKEN